MSVSLGCFSTYIGVQSLIYAELFPVILAMESSLERNWRKVWFECDSILVMEAFKNPSLVPWRLRRNSCANLLVNHRTHSRISFFWWDNVPFFVRTKYLRNRHTLPTYIGFLDFVHGFWSSLVPHLVR
ncbi:hypothetical protein JHK82_049507 [Glycine max]|uniref:RNase H type-1 domain-containing protein n=2 Tax=Glycine subgen. Soja TaxID=1462606 RepID=A0A0R0F7B9_SOYBN|nr:hypothetical protein JHK86_049365 [Glycine max]KAG4923649.1 hypothetical protein JHK87_049189 [Glycine soja]KAG4935210.1 hypothetical protein JHK85_050129 [Glycine max]KAG5090729.1 hypothetical protein JHK82_049507 [Glycine max]KAG5093817.1 hypothetical protein JHK84_049405 [Glycine max]